MHTSKTAAGASFHWLAVLSIAVASHCDAALAQVAPGTAVVCTWKGSFTTGTPGLYLVPLDGGPVIPITGLPPELQPSPTSVGTQGAVAVSIRASDGAVIVTTKSGAATSTGGTVYLFVLHLNGSAVIPALTQQITLGTAGPAPNLGSTLHCVMPDGKILVAANASAGPLTIGAMAGHILAIVDTAAVPPSFNLLPNPPFILGPPGGLAIDPTGEYLYWAQSTAVWGQGTSDAYVHRLHLSTNTNCPVATLLGESVFGLRCDDDGTLYLSATAAQATPPTHSIYAVRFNGCNPATVTSVPSSLLLLSSGLDLDRSTGRFVAMSAAMRPWLTPFLVGPQPQLESLCAIVPATGHARVVTNAPFGGWGAIGFYGVAVSNAIESYGVSTPPVGALNHYWFENFPNPGGLPELGNMDFSLTMKAAPGVPALSALLLSFDRGMTNVLGVKILVGLSSAVSAFVTPGLSVEHPLPLPNVLALRGLVLRAQSVHLEPGGGVAASRGLEFALL